MTDDLVEAQLAAAREARGQKVIPINWFSRYRNKIKFRRELTVRHWELGLGVYIGNRYTDRITGFKAYAPPMLTLYLGPLTLEWEFGHRIDY